MSQDKAIPSSHVLILSTPGHTPNSTPIVGMPGRILNHQLIVTIDTVRAVTRADGSATTECLNTFVATWECGFTHEPQASPDGLSAHPVNHGDLNFSPWCTEVLDFNGRRTLRLAICAAVAEAYRTQHTSTHWVKFDGLLATPTPNPGMPHQDRTKPFGHR